MPNSQYEKLARGALLEITDTTSIGALVGEQVESDGAVSVIFASAMRGYPGWNWTVSIAHIEGSEPTVLEAELMPAEGALLSPDWVPWSERLADYKAAQAATEAADAEKMATDESSSSDDYDHDDDDEDDDDVFDSAVLHGGDLDGVDIDDDSDEDDDDYDSGVFRGGDHEGVSVDDLDDSGGDDDDDEFDDDTDD